MINSKFSNILLLVLISILGAIAIVIIILSVHKLQAPATPVNNSIPETSNWEDCTNASEVEYRSYVLTKDSYTEPDGDIMYKLSPSEWETINKKRADQIDACSKKYPDQVH